VRPDEIARLPVAALRARYLEAAEPLPQAVAEALEADPRAGARAVLRAVERRRAANRVEGRRLSRLLVFEEALWAQGVARVAGVDEAGMGTLAGPVVAAAVVLPRAFRPRGLDDSKKLDAAARERLAAEIRAGAEAVGVGEASPQEVDALNVYRAGLLAMRRAVEALGARPDHLLVDARRIPELGVPQQGIVKGDARSLSIAAASVVAKVTRDALMAEAEARWPGYGFGRHKGYGAPEHLAALARLGPCPIHRRTFAPVAEALGTRPVQADLFAPPPPRPRAGGAG
jgi:ribonuclease HII